MKDIGGQDRSGRVEGGWRASNGAGKFNVPNMGEGHDSAAVVGAFRSVLLYTVGRQIVIVENGLMTIVVQSEGRKDFQHTRRTPCKKFKTYARSVD